MPTFNTQQLLKSLERDIQKTIKEAGRLQAYSEETLNMQPHAGKWSIAQIMEHLNTYNRYYLPAIEAAIQKGEKKKIKPSTVFTTGVFGGYFTRLMQPRENGKIKRMKSPDGHTPRRILDGQAALNEFIESQHRMMELLQLATTTNMQKLKVPITISKLIKLRLGDTFRFLVAHQQRHFLQLAVAVKQVKATETLMRMVA